jgi:hypothetical protein
MKGDNSMTTDNTELRIVQLSSDCPDTITNPNPHNLSSDEPIKKTTTVPSILC